MPINWLKRKRAKRYQRFTLLESLKELAFLMYRYKGTNFFYCANIFDKNYFLCAFFIVLIVNVLHTFNYF